jgi:hypothetical protein
MQRLLSLLSEIQDYATIEYMKDTIIEIMKTVSDAARYTQAYLEKNTLGVYVYENRGYRLNRDERSEKWWETQISKDLDALKERFTTLDGEVKNAMVAQTLSK